jgi:diacylglycerol O-acyltransferase
MDKLNFQDASFLRLESSRHPFHVAGLMVLKPPANAPRNYVRKLVARCGQLNEVWPVFNKKLSDPEDLSNGAWIPEDNYHPERHVLHYALPQPGRMSDLLDLVSRAHERQLDRGRPLWEIHFIEGLPGKRFAVYCKVHHALIDGAGGMKMMNALFTTSPRHKIELEDIAPVVAQQAQRHSLLQDLGEMGRGMLQQYRALPELSSLLAHMGVDALRGKDETMHLPFTAPRSIFNTEMDSARRIVICDLPFNAVRKLARTTGGSINDVLLSVCGGALRRYLLQQKALPRKSLLAGLPVSIKSADAQEGNQLSFILCPFFTREADDLKRLQRVIKTTSKAKSDLAHMSTTANQDLTNLILMPAVLLTLTGNATRVTPAINAIFSNVPGSRQKLYMEGAELESLYPLSVVTDGMGLNLTVISYGSKLCFAITSCPTQQPGIEQLGDFLKQGFRDLQAAVMASAGKIL